MIEQFKNTWEYFSGNLLSCWAVMLSGLVLGTMFQFGWINEHCANEPFLSETGVCQDNVLRMVLGGPLFLILVIGLFLLIAAYILSRSPKTTNIKKKSDGFIRSLSDIFGILALSIFWPAFGYSSMYMLFVFLFFLFMIFYSRWLDFLIMPDFKKELFLIWGYMKENIGQYALVPISGLVIGTIVQLNWINENCTGQLFWSGTTKICQDNTLRMALGGPVFLFLLYGVYLAFTALCFLAFNRKKKEKQKQKFSQRLSNIFGILILLLFWPYFDYAATYLSVILISLPVLVGFVLYKCLSNQKPPISITYDTMYNENKLSIEAKGMLVVENKLYMLTALLDVLSLLESFKIITVSLKAVEKLDSTGKNFLTILDESCRMLDLQFSTDDEKALSAGPKKAKTGGKSSSKKVASKPARAPKRKAVKPAKK